jgi:hypothetical protein
LGAQLGKLREWVSDVAGGHVEAGTDQKPRPAPGGMQGSLGTGGISAEIDELAGEERAPGVQRSGRREGLGLGEKLLIGEQFAGIAAEDQLQRMAVLDAGQSVTGAPELICDRFHNFHARSDAKIAVVKGAAFSRACASVIDPRGSLRRLSSHVRHTSTVTRTTIDPATSRATTTIGHMFLYLSRGPHSPSAVPGQ